MCVHNALFDQRGQNMLTVQILYTVKYLITKLRLWHPWVCFRRRQLFAYNVSEGKRTKARSQYIYQMIKKWKKKSFIWKATPLLQVWFVGVFVALRPSTFCGIHDVKRKVVWSNLNQNTLPLSCPTDYNDKSKILENNPEIVSMLKRGNGDGRDFFLLLLLLLFCFTGRITLTPQDTHESNNKPASRQNKCNANKQSSE